MRAAYADVTLCSTVASMGILSPARRFRSAAVLAALTALLLPMTVAPVSAAASVSERAHDWLVGLRFSDGSTFCSGVLIAPRRVITAAHCAIDHPKQSAHLTITNLTGETVSLVRKATPHPRFSIIKDNGPRRTHVVADIAVLHLTRAVHLPQYPAVAVSSVRGEVYLYGMSSYRPAVELPLRQITKKASTWFNHVDPQRHIVAVSAAGTASCSGDSGGGLIVWESGAPTLTGVVSYGAVRCGDPVPTVFTRVSAYSDWLRDALR